FEKHESNSAATRGRPYFSTLPTSTFTKFTRSQWIRTFEGTRARYNLEHDGMFYTAFEPTLSRWPSSYACLCHIAPKLLDCGGRIFHDRLRREQGREDSAGLDMETTKKEESVKSYHIRHHRDTHLDHHYLNSRDETRVADVEEEDEKEEKGQDTVDDTRVRHSKWPDHRGKNTVKTSVVKNPPRIK
ncbi:LOW QUALITY PROTEIN: hypothetical protein CVT26_005903, partial [Gymnopilus dilepis]